MSCGHWFGERRTRTLAKRLGLPIVAVRRCTGLLVLADGRKLRYDFHTGRVTEALLRNGLPVPLSNPEAT